METGAYLKRINYDDVTDVSVETLRRLQVAHLYSVPFENLSIHNSEPIVLDDEALFEKIVKRQRGGFCYELNGLFAKLLKSLGFTVTKLSAEVAHPDGGYSQPFDHMTLLVTLDQPWLVDVGFGDSFLEPLRLTEKIEQPQGGRTYRIDRADEYFVMLQRVDGEEWRPQYRFTLRSHEYPDYEEMCHYHQTSPESHFTQKRVCSLATPEGRITLSGMRLITTTINGGRSERELNNEAEVDRLLETRFGIKRGR